MEDQAQLSKDKRELRTWTAGSARRRWRTWTI